MNKINTQMDGIANLQGAIRPMMREFDLNSMLGCLYRQRIRMLSVTMAVTILTTAFVFSVKPKYTTELKIIFEGTTTPAMDLEAAVSGRPQDEVTILSEIEVFKSRGLAKRVIEALNLKSVPEFSSSAWTVPGLWAYVMQHIGSYLSKSDKAPPEGKAGAGEGDALEQRTADRFLDRLDIRPVGRSRAVRVLFTSEDPVRAAEVANALAKQYLLVRLEARFQDARQASEWLAMRVQELRENVDRAERAVEKYRNEHNLFQGERVTLTEEQITDLNLKRVDASIERAAAEANLAQAKRVAGKTNDLASLAPVLQSELIQRLRAEQVGLERREAEMKNNYGPRHPLTIQLQAEKTKFKETIELEVRKIINALENQVDIATRREAALSKDLNALKAQVARANTASVGLRALERDAEANRLMLGKFMTVFMQATAQSDIRAYVPNAWVASPATTPVRPSFPRKTMMIFFAVLGGALLSIPLAFAAEARDRAYRSAEQLESDTGLPVLAHIPKLRSWVSDREFVTSYVLEHPHSAYSEAVRSLYRRLLLLPSSTHPPKSVLLSSPEPGAGKTSLALSMGRMLARNGRKVLIIDADLRRGVMAELLGLVPEKGLIELVTGRAELWEVLQRDPATQTDVIVRGGSSSEGVDIFASGTIGQRLQELQSMYDLVIIDTPPVSALSDACVLASEVDATVFVIEWGATRREVVGYTLNQMKAAKANIAGLVLSKVDLRQHAEYSYGDSRYLYKESLKYHAN